MGLLQGRRLSLMVERNMSRAAMRGTATLPGSKATSRTKGPRRNLGGPAFDHRQQELMVRIGKARSRSR